MLLTQPFKVFLETNPWGAFLVMENFSREEHNKFLDR